ncbi:MAG: homocysteine S-methyltransferase family protein [Pseudomonadota bacterium]
MTIEILDGSMGQELVRRVGELNTRMWGIGVMRDDPEIVRAVHDDYFAAGADIATTNTYNIHPSYFAGCPYPDEFEELTRLACELACASRDANGAGVVAGGVGPTGWSYRPELGNDIDAATEEFGEIARIMGDYVDVMLIETMSSHDAARGAVAGSREAGKPIWLSMTVDDFDGGLLRSGDPVESAVSLAEELGVERLFLNCSRPEAMTEALPRITGKGLPIGAYANGFTHITDAFKGDDGQITDLSDRKDLGPNAYADFAEQWAAAGVTTIGGCCEVGPAHIAEVARRLK